MKEVSLWAGHKFENRGAFLPTICVLLPKARRRGVAAIHSCQKHKNVKND